MVIITFQSASILFLESLVPHFMMVHFLLFYYNKRQKPDQVPFLSEIFVIFTNRICLAFSAFIISMTIKIYPQNYITHTHVKTFSKRERPSLSVPPIHPRIWCRKEMRNYADRSALSPQMTTTLSWLEATVYKSHERKKIPSQWAAGEYLDSCWSNSNIERFQRFSCANYFEIPWHAVFKQENLFSRDKMNFY